MPERGADLPVRLHAVASARRAPLAHDDVVLFAARGDVGERDVRNLEQDRARARASTSASSRSSRAISSPSARPLRDQIVGGLACAFLRRATSCELALRAAFRSSTA